MDHPPLGFTAVFWFCVAIPLCIALHELGHAIGGWIGGMRVLAFGIGMRRPFFSVRILGTSFYLAWPLYGGLTFAVDEMVHTAPWKYILMTAGGPFASFTLSCWAAYSLFDQGYHPFYAGIAVMAGRDFLATAYPRHFWMSGAYHPNDAAIIRSYWRGDEHLLMGPGDGLAMCHSIREFFRRLKHVRGEVHYTLHMVMAQLEFDDFEAARVTLNDPILSSPRRGSAGKNLEALVRALLAERSGAGEDDDAIRDARLVLEDDAYGLAILELDIASSLHARGVDARAQLARAMDSCRAAGLPHLCTTAEAIRVVVEPPDDLADQIRRLLALRGANQLSPTAALSLCAQATSIFATRGDRDRALEYHRDSLERLQAITSGIADQAVRERYATAYSEPLKAAINMLGIPETDLATEEVSTPVPVRQRTADGLTPLGTFILFVVAVLLLLTVIAVVLTEIQRMGSSH